MPRQSASLAPPGRLPASLRPSRCSAALPGGRSVTASAARALPFWRSGCSPQPGFTRWLPRVSVLLLANHERLDAADRDRKSVIQSRDEIGKSGYDRRCLRDRLRRTVSPGFRGYSGRAFANTVNEDYEGTGEIMIGPPG